MRVIRWQSPKEFGQDVDRHLRRSEAANNLMLGLLDGLSEAESPILAAVEGSGEIRLAALQTARSFNLILSFADDNDAANLLAEALRSQGAELPGVLGPVDLAAAFSRRWAELSGQVARIQMRERIYEIREVLPAHSESKGCCRWAMADDALWLVAWIEAFTQEAMPDAPVRDAQAVVAERLQKPFPIGGYLIMTRDGVPVSVAGYGRPTGTGVRVGPVYTPPALRGLGYASLTVRKLTQRLIDAGYQSVFLFTDLDNPTSNSIYQNIGYRAVTDVDQYQFF